MRYWLCGGVPDLQSAGCRFESRPGLLDTKVYSAFHPSGVSKWVPTIAGKTKAGMAQSNCSWTCGDAGKTVKSLENTCHTRALLWWWFTTKRHYVKHMHLYLVLRRFKSMLTRKAKCCGWHHTMGWPLYEVSQKNHFMFSFDTYYVNGGELFTGNFILWHPVHSIIIFDLHILTTCDDDDDDDDAGKRCQIWSWSQVDDSHKESSGLWWCRLAYVAWLWRRQAPECITRHCCRTYALQLNRGHHQASLSLWTKCWVVVEKQQQHVYWFWLLDAVSNWLISSCIVHISKFVRHCRQIY